MLFVHRGRHVQVAPEVLFTPEFVFIPAFRACFADLPVDGSGICDFRSLSVHPCPTAAESAPDSAATRPGSTGFRWTRRGFRGDCTAQEEGRSGGCSASGAGCAESHKSSRDGQLFAAD